MPIHQFYSTSWQSMVLLFNSFCTSLYGCQLWNLDDPRIEEFSVAWRVCCRRLLALHPRTRSHILPLIMNSYMFVRLLKKESRVFLLGFWDILSDKYHIFLEMFCISTHHTRPIWIRYYSLITLHPMKFFTVILTMFVGQVRCLEDYQYWQTEIIKELLSIRDGQIDCGLTLHVCLYVCVWLCSVIRPLSITATPAVTKVEQNTRAGEQPNSLRLELHYSLFGVLAGFF